MVLAQSKLFEHCKLHASEWQTGVNEGNWNGNGKQGAIKDNNNNNNNNNKSVDLAEINFSAGAQLYSW